MNTALKLFSKTFARIPQMQNQVAKLQQNLKEIDQLYILQQRAKMLFVSQLIMKQAADLQSPKPVQILNNFTQRYDEIKYDYENNNFELTKRKGDKQIKYKIDSIFVQRFDHPFFRQSLYFHELKNGDKYLDIKVPTNFPKYMQDFYRKTAIQNSLDKKNPLGVPHWANPLTVQVQITKNDIICGFNFVSKLGKTALSQCYNKKQNYTFLINPLYFEKDVYEFVYQFLRQNADITPKQIQMMSKLAFIGGSLDKTELMLNIFQQLSGETFKIEEK